MANAKKLPSGSWRVQATKTINGKRTVKSFTVSPNDFTGDLKQCSLKAKAQAELMARNWMFDMEEEINHVSVEKAMQKHLEKHANVWSESTLADYVRMPKYFERIKTMDCMDVNSENLQDLINEWACKGLSKKTMTNRIGFIKDALEFVGVDRLFRLKYPKSAEEEYNPPEHSEFKRLLSIANEEELLMIVLAGLYTLRRNELGGLCGEDILWDMNSIYVHTSRVKNKDKEWVRRKLPKTTQSIRRIQIAPEVMAMIPHVGPNEYIFEMTPDAMTHRFERLRDKVGVTCRLHDLRKYAASIRSEIMPHKYVEADGGWKPDSKVLKKVYDKPFKETRCEYSKKINDLIIEDYGDQLLGS